MSLVVTSVQTYPLTHPTGKTHALARVMINDTFQLTGLKVLKLTSEEHTVVLPELIGVTDNIDGAGLMEDIKRSVLSKHLSPEFHPLSPFVNEVDVLRVTGLSGQETKPGTTGKTLLVASAVIEGALVLHGLRLVNGSNGIFLSYPCDPSYKGDDYRSLYYPVTKAQRDYVESHVISKWESGYFKPVESYNDN